MHQKIICSSFLLLVLGLRASLAQAPEPISTTLLFAIAQSGYEKADTRIIAKQTDWDEIGRKASLDLPAVDFSKEKVLVITAGKCASTGYEIKVSEISQIDPPAGASGKKLVVKYLIAPPIDGEPISKTPTTPLLALKINRTDLPIEFVRSEKEIEELIKQLGDKEWKTRQAATMKLIEWGKITVPAVLKALQDKDPEIVMRARLIIKEVVQTLLIERSGWIGIQMMEIPSSDERISSFINEGVGAEVVTIIAGTPAEKFGLRPDDIIIGFDGQKLESLEAFRKTIRQTLPETRVNLTIIRKGEKIDIPLVLGVRPEEYRKELKEDLWNEWAEKYLPKTPQ